MGIVTTSKLNNLLSKSIPGGLLFAGWLRNEGYSSQLLKKYRDSGWLEGLARGVMYRRNDNLSALTAVYCYNQDGTMFTDGFKSISTGSSTDYYYS